jgi:hypothetical protein
VVTARGTRPQAHKQTATSGTALAAERPRISWRSSGPAAVSREEESDSTHQTAAEPTPLTAEELDLREAESTLLNARWSSQQTDPAWSKASEATIAKLLLDQGFSFEVMRELDCRQTICRFVLDAEDGPRALALLGVGRRVHDETWLDHTAQHDGSWTIEVFFSRPGYRLSGDGGRIEGQG